MPRHAVILAALVLPLAGCVSYPVAQRGDYYEVIDGGYYVGRERHPHFDRGVWSGSIRYSSGWRGDSWGWGLGWGPSPWAWRSHPWDCHPQRWGCHPWGWRGSSWGWSGPFHVSPWHAPVHSVPRPLPRPLREQPRPKPFVIDSQPMPAEPIRSGVWVGGEPVHRDPIDRRTPERHFELESRPEPERHPAPEPHFERPIHEDLPQRFQKPMREEAPIWEEESRPRFEEPEPDIE